MSLTIDPPILRTALEAWREGDLLALAASPLAATAWVADVLLAGEPPTPDARARALQANLRWGIERLQPDTPPNWNTSPWRAYHVLCYFYGDKPDLVNIAVAQFADKISVSVQTVYDARASAIERLAALLQAELQHPQATAERQGLYLAARYARRPASEQHTLCALALFQHPVPLAALESVVGPTLAQVDWAGLLASFWVSSDAHYRAICLHPQVRPYLQAQLHALGTEKLRAWHRAAATYCTAQQDYLAAIEHWRAAERGEAAAALLIAHYTDLFNAGDTEALRATLTRLRPAEVTPTQWAQLRLLAGQLAEAMQDTPTAFAEYGQALGIAPAPALKAEAYYRLARAFRMQGNITQALTHYQRCIELLTVEPTSVQTPPRYWVLAWVGQALIYMDERRDRALARAALDHIAADMAAYDPQVQTRCYNALGQWAYTNQDHALAEERLSRAWALATEGRDLEMRLHVGYNLGSLYAEVKPPQALGYLTDALAAAQQLGLRRNESLCRKGLGEYYFRQGAYAQAAEHYQQALALAQAMDNGPWQAALSYDLAESYALAGDLVAAQRYFAVGQPLARTLAPQYLDLFAALAADHPALLNAAAPPPIALPPRWQQILAYAQTHSPFTSGDCAAYLGLSKEQTLRELNPMVAAGYLVRTGTGRGTRYAGNSGG